VQSNRICWCYPGTGWLLQNTVSSTDILAWKSTCPNISWWKKAIQEGKKTAEARLITSLLQTGASCLFPPHAHRAMQGRTRWKASCRCLRSTLPSALLVFTVKALPWNVYVAKALQPDQDTSLLMVQPCAVQCLMCCWTRTSFRWFGIPLLETAYNQIQRRPISYQPLINSFTTAAPVPPEKKQLSVPFFALPHWHTQHNPPICWMPSQESQPASAFQQPLSALKETLSRGVLLWHGIWVLQEGCRASPYQTISVGEHQPLKRSKTYTYRHLGAPSVSRGVLTEQLCFSAGHKTEALLCLKHCKERMVLDYGTSLLCPLAPRCSTLKGNISSPLGKLQKNVAVTHINYIPSRFRTQ